MIMIKKIFFFIVLFYSNLTYSSLTDSVRPIKSIQKSIQISAEILGQEVPKISIQSKIIGNSNKILIYKNNKFLDVFFRLRILSYKKHDSINIDVIQPTNMNCYFGSSKSHIPYFINIDGIKINQGINIYDMKKRWNSVTLSHNNYFYSDVKINIAFPEIQKKDDIGYCYGNLIMINSVDI